MFRWAHTVPWHVSVHPGHEDDGVLRSLAGARVLRGGALTVNRLVAEHLGAGRRAEQAIGRVASRSGAFAQPRGVEVERGGDAARHRQRDDARLGPLLVHAAA